MSRLLVLFWVGCLTLASSAFAQEPDAEGCQDSPLFNRMSGYYIQRCTPLEFERHEFPGAGGKVMPQEGRYLELLYAVQPGGKEYSRAQILRNYENAVVAIGGSVVGRDDEGNISLKLVSSGKETWVHVSAYITSQYVVYIVEKGEMAQTIVANAAALQAGIKSGGHVPVYGLYFDTGKSELKPESDAALTEIAKLLKADASLKLHVVGHTDNVAGLELNMKLSLARAEAVVQALVSRHGIASSRLKAAGVGPLCPVTSNDSEEGRAKNRRVDLVKQ